jgi:hypothetical protein
MARRPRCSHARNTRSGGSCARWSDALRADLRYAGQLEAPQHVDYLRGHDSNVLLSEGLREQVGLSKVH